MALSRFSFGSPANYWKKNVLIDDENKAMQNQHAVSRKLKPLIVVLFLFTVCVGGAFAQADEGIARITKLITARPNNDKLYVERGWAYSQIEKYDDALADAVKALQIDPKNGEALLLRGRSKHNKKDFDGAIADYSLLINAASDYGADVYFWRAQLYEVKGEYEKALADYKKAGEINSITTEMMAGYRTRLESKMKAEGITPSTATSARNKDGENKAAWEAFQAADKFIKKLEWNAAIDEYSKAIALDPEFAAAYANRARLYGNDSKFDQAIADYAEAIRLKPDYADAFESRGGLYYIYNKSDLALADYTEAIRLVPTFSDAYLNRGRVYSKLNQNDKAAADWEKFLQLAPNSSNAELARGYLANIRRSTSSTSPANSAAASSPTNSSKCVSGDCRNGYGKYLDPVGNIYEGNWVNGKLNGKGKATQFNGDTYEGDYSDSKREGQGTYTFKTGDVYFGHFANNSINGKGKRNFPNGNIYEGDWVNGIMEGQGIYTVKNGNYYSGEWKNSKQNGYGKEFVKATNVTREGTWKDGILVNSTTAVTSPSKGSDTCVSGNCANGKGKYIYPNGDTYEGNFVNGKKDGQGTLAFPSGNVYIGQFANNVFNGKGIYKFADGEIYDGNWVDNKRSGKGKTTFDGDIYEGDYVNGKKEGRGTYTFKDGDYYTGEWKNNNHNGYGKFYNKATNTTQEGPWKDGVFVGSSSAKASKTEAEWQKICDPFVGKMEITVNTKKDDESAQRIYSDFEKETQTAGESKVVRNTRKALLKTMHQSNSYPLMKFVREKLETLNYNEEETKDILSPRLYYV